MTMELQAHIASEGEYRVERRFGCKIIWGSIPINDLVNLTKDADPKIMMSTDLPNKIGAAFVFGTKEDLEAMRNHPDLPISGTRIVEAERARREGYPEAFAQWLIHGDRGLSSNAIAQSVTGVIKGEKLKSHPHDPSDLGRCLEVIEVLKCDKLSEDDILKCMVGVSETWRNLVFNWPELKKLHAEESEECYELLKEAAKS